VPAPAWIAALGLTTVLVLRRGSLDATVAFAIVVGATNIILLASIALLALGHVDAARLTAIPELPSPSAAGLVFGVLLGAYFGHTAAATASKIVLARDPSGRALLRGSVAAMGAATVLYIVVIVAILGAVPPALLEGSAGTALEPLARETGPVVAILGGIFVVLAMGLASILTSLALYNQTLEVLLDRPAIERRLRGRQVATWLAAAAPIVALFLVTTVVFEAGLATFAGPIALLGTIGTPVVAGVFPALLVVAARRRGEYPSASSIPGIGRPLVAATIAGLFIAGALVQGWIVAGDPATELATTLVAIAIVFLVVQAIRGGAFRPRAVLDVRVPERSGPDRVALVVAGRQLPIEPIVGITTMDVALPPIRELGLWAHRVTDDGDTVPVGLAARTVSGEPRDLGTTDGEGRLTAFLDGQATTIALRHVPREAAS
jgi:amino acid permease